MVQIHRISLPLPGLEALQVDASAEGYAFIERLVHEWESGVNRFQDPGEILCGHLDNGQIVAVGGLNLDPFAGRQDVARLRRIYVRPTWRGKGIGKSLVIALIDEARVNFAAARLRAANQDAARLYESLGFVPLQDSNATHILRFDGQTPNR